MSELSRRMLVTATAALPVLAVPRFAAAESDPVFAVVAAHRDAYVNRLRTSRPTVTLEPNDPREAELEAADDAAREVEDEARWELSEVMPATIAGAIALLRYIEEFQEQAIELQEEPKHWHSSADDPVILDKIEHPSLVDKFNGELLELPLSYWVMQNVRIALQTLAGEA
jgi:hypothetical protein